VLGLRLRVITSEGELGEFAVTPKVQVEFERHFKIGVGKAFQQNRRLSTCIGSHGKLFTLPGSL